MIYLNETITNTYIDEIKDLTLPSRLNKAKNILNEEEYNSLVICYALLKISLYKEQGFILNDNSKFIFDKNHKPHLENCPKHFNFAYDKNIALCVIDNHPVGVQVFNKFVVKEKMLNLVLTSDELDFFKQDNEYFYYCYLNKESYFKYLGKNHNLTYKDVDLSYYSSDLFRYKDKNFFFVNEKDHYYSVCNEGELFYKEHVIKLDNKEILDILKSIN